MDLNNVAGIFAAVLLSCAVVFISYLNLEMYGQATELYERIQFGERYVLFDLVRNKTVIDQAKINGVYQPSTDIFCYYPPAARDEFDKTKYHEYCHWVIDEGHCVNDSQPISCRVHFCG